MVLPRLLLFALSGGRQKQRFCVRVFERTSRESDRFVRICCVQKESRRGFEFVVGKEEEQQSRRRRTGHQRGLRERTPIFLVRVFFVVRRRAEKERASSAPSGKIHPRRVGPKLEDGEDEKDETNAVELTRASLLKTPTEFKREMKREKSEKERRKEEAALAWFENTHPSSQYKMDEFERRQKEKEEFDAKMREEREKEEKRLTKKIEWFDDPVKEDDDDLWIADRRWQYDKNDPLMDFEDYEHDQTEEEKKIDYGELLLKRIKKKVTSMKTVEDLITYQKDLMSSYGILNAEKAVEKQKEAENDQAAELAKKEIEENPAKATKSAAFALDAELFEKALQRKTEREAEARVQKKTKNRNLDYNRKLFEKAMAAKKAREEQQKRR